MTKRNPPKRGPDGRFVKRPDQPAPKRRRRSSPTPSARTIRRRINGRIVNWRVPD